MPGGYVTLTNRATGQDELVDTDQALAAISSGKYLDPGAVAVQRNGMATYTTPDVAAREQTFAPVVDPAQAAREHGHLLREQENTGALATAKAFAGGAASGLTFGLVDPFADAREFNPVASGLGQVAGAVAPAFAGDLGGLVGLGRDAAVADDALTAERAAGSLSSKALYAGEAAAGTAEGDIVRGAKRIGAAAAETTRPTAAVATAPDAALPVLEDLDKAGLEAARKQEIDAIDAARAPARRQFVDEFRAANDATQEAQPWKYSKGSPNRFIRGSGKEALEADIKVRSLLKNEAGLTEKPERALDALQRQYQAYGRLLESAETEIKQFRYDFSVAPERVRADILGGKVDTYPVPSALTERGVQQAVHDEIVRRFGSTAVPVLPERLSTESIGAIESTLNRNMALQKQLAQLTAEPTSERLQQIDSMLAERAAPHEASLGERLLHSVAPYAGPIGAVAEKAYAGLRKLVGVASKGASKTASSFADVATKAAPHVPLIASRVLASAVFAPTAAGVSVASQLASAPPVTKAPAGKPSASAPAAAQGGDLNAHYQRVTDEIRSQTMYDPLGNIVMRPEARAAMARQLDAIRAVSPTLADRMETVGAKRLEYLASIIPKLPDYGTMQVGPDRRRTPDLLQRSFARSVAAVEDPHAAMARIVSGRFVTEDANALRAVYPEMVADQVHQIVPQLATLQRSLPYARRLSLSMLTGQPVDPAMTPTVLRELQSMYANEPATEGGTQAPTPQPQFGSVKRSDPGTPAQRRQGLTA